MASQIMLILNSELYLRTRRFGLALTLASTCLYPLNAISGIDECKIAVRTQSETKVQFGIKSSSIMSLFSESFYKGDVVSIVMRELIQNSIDAIHRRKRLTAESVPSAPRKKKGVFNLIKDLVSSETEVSPPTTVVSQMDTPGAINLYYDFQNRKLIIEDNGSGMNLDTIRNAFFRLGGSDKEAGEAGGYGIAKGLLLSVSQQIYVSTIQAGTKHEFTVNSDLLNKNPDDYEISVHTTKSESNESGTIVVIDFNEKVIAPKMKYQISLTNAVSLIDDIKVSFFEVNTSNLEHSQTKAYLRSFRASQPSWQTEKDTRLFRPLNYNDLDFLTSHLEFPFGSVDIFLEKAPDPSGWGTQSVLNNGLWQFRTLFMEPGTSNRIPNNLIINVKPKVKTSDPQYPFGLTRDGFRPSVENEYAIILQEATRMVQILRTELIHKEFADLVDLPQVDVQAKFTSLLSQVPPPEYLDDREPTVKHLKDNHTMNETTSSSKLIGPSILRNSIGVQINDLPDALILFSELAGVIDLMKNRLSQLTRDTDPPFSVALESFRAGIYLNPANYGVNLSGTLDAIFINPLALPNDEQLTVISEMIANTILHEITHVKIPKHDDLFPTIEMKLRLLLARDQFMPTIKMLIESVLRDHRETFLELVNRYDQVKPKN